ncbi:MAG TPA: SDR family oxidoreductase, partial [Aggregatilineales bacterium]|nr:SDR family oxidoreductase [Aggregatilineales bacterium]
MDLVLKDMRVLVAASSQGLGAATAVQCALEGARVTINGRDPAKLAKAAAAMRESTNSDILAIPADVARAEDVRRLVDDAATQMGGIDILVTNCGGPPAGTFEQITPEQWQEAVNLVLMSAVNLIRVALPIMRLSDSPSILAITSASTKQAMDNLLLSNAVRMGVAGLVKTLANELGPKGIRVNAILPGYTRTDRITS